MGEAAGDPFSRDPAAEARPDQHRIVEPQFFCPALFLPAPGCMISRKIVKSKASRVQPTHWVSFHQGREGTGAAKVDISASSSQFVLYRRHMI
jgi:hypothetical protein